MPKAGSSAPKTGAKRGPKAHKLAVTFSSGTVLKDTFKKEWKLGNVIGQGGFGLIYKASDAVTGTVSDTAPYVVKIEPAANGPLFCELHFYQRVAKPDNINEWTRKKKLKYLPVPKLCGAGNYTYQSEAFRFLVMPRFSTDLQKLFESCGKSFPPKSVYAVGLRMIDALEYIHEYDYVHADIKAANILMGYKNGKTLHDEVFLVDFGLAFKYVIDGKHKEYKEDPRKAHDGTIEFTSRDAHNGVSPSRRGDFEILGYCLLQWLCGQLPWEDNLNNKDYVGNSKAKYMKDIPSLIQTCFPAGNAPDTISIFLTAVSKLKYDEKPNYEKFLQTLKQGISKNGGGKDEWKLNLPVDGSSSPAKSRKIVKDSKASTSKTPVKDSPKIKGRKRKSEELVQEDDEERELKMPSNMTPAARLVYAKINSNKNASSSKSKNTVVKSKASPVKSSPVKKSSASLSKSPVPLKRQKRETKSVNYHDDSLSDDDDDDDISDDVICEDSINDSDFENTPQNIKRPSSRSKTGSPKSPKATKSKSPGMKNKGTKRMVRRKKKNQVDASIQTSPSVRGKK